MRKFKIDLYPVFYQQTSIKLSISSYYFDFLWSEINNGWIYTIYDKNKSPILSGRTLRLGVNLFENVSRAGELKMEGEIPTRVNFGINCHLFFYEINNDN